MRMIKVRGQIGQGFGLRIAMDHPSGGDTFDLTWCKVVDRSSHNALLKGLAPAMDLSRGQTSNTSWSLNKTLLNKSANGAAPQERQGSHDLLTAHPSALLSSSGRSCEHYSFNPLVRI
jgi:hypothetical protein